MAIDGTFASPPSSENVSPVTPQDNPTDKLLNVGPRAASGLPDGTRSAAANNTDSLITKAYDLLAYRVLRDNLVFDQFATVRTTRLTHNGAAVQFNFIGDLADAAPTILQENYDVLPEPLKSWSTSLTMNEYGKVVTQTALHQATTMIPIDPVIAERIGRSAGTSMDRLAIASLYAAGGLNNDGSAGAVPTAVAPVAGKPSDTLRKIAQTFMEKNVEPLSMNNYVAVISPASETALRGESDAAGWRYWQANNSANGIAQVAGRYIGEYEGFTILVSNRLTAGKDLFLGQDALAKVYPSAPGFGPQPRIVVSPVVDRLRRFASVGWYHIVGYGRFRSEAVITSNLAA